MNLGGGQNGKRPYRAQRAKLGTAQLSAPLHAARFTVKSRASSWSEQRGGQQGKFTKGDKIESGSGFHLWREYIPTLFPLLHCFQLLSRSALKPCLKPPKSHQDLLISRPDPAEIGKAPVQFLLGASSLVLEVLGLGNSWCGAFACLTRLLECELAHSRRYSRSAVLNPSKTLH
jgi:hypothetical protein